MKSHISLGESFENKVAKQSKTAGPPKYMNSINFPKKYFTATWKSHDCKVTVFTLCAYLSSLEIKAVPLISITGFFYLHFVA